MNNMKEIRIEKITLNIGTGKPGPELDKAKILLEKISGRKSIETKTTKRIPGWKIRPGLPLGSKVTIRGDAAEKLLVRLLSARDNKVKPSSFTVNGFSFGVPEYIDIPEVKYDPKIGIIGLDVCVSLKRTGYRVKNRRLFNTKIGGKHAISKAEAIKFAQDKFGVKSE